MTLCIYNPISLLPYAKNSLSGLLILIHFTLFQSLLAHLDILQLDILFYHYIETGTNKVLNDIHLTKSIVLTLPSSTCHHHLTRLTTL